MTVDISGHVAGCCETAGNGLGDESVVVLVSIRHVPINLPLVELLRHFPQHNAHICGHGVSVGAGPAGHLYHVGPTEPG